MMLRKFLFNVTARLPCRLIHRGQGQRYLERYWLGRWFGITAYLHRFVARDADEWVHDHPWRWSIAIVLTGGYREERLQWFDPATGWRARLRKIGGIRRINVIRAGDFHRIVERTPETWTLFIHSPRVKGWGFLKREKASPRRCGMSEGCRLHDITVYMQPYNTAANVHWQTSANLGRDAARAPLGVSNA